MTDALFHRGPDDGGVAQLSARDGGTAGAFGNRRLAIIDLSPAGHQPMFSRDGRYCITYNGEIYNYLEIRAELEADGLTFRGWSDTEVFLAAWQRHGLASLKKLRGMFAAGIWDAVERRGFLMRDEFGIKPLYYAAHGDAILFASEVRALLASKLIPRTLCAEAVETYLATGSVSEPLTIIEGIHSVPAGCAQEIFADGPRVRLGATQRFANPFAPSGDDGDASGSNSARALRTAMRDSVAHHLISDVPLGLFLSGGLDSSSLVALASEVSDKTIDTFTVTFDESGYSEAEPAREIALRHRTRHREIPLAARDLLSALPEFFEAMDQPSMDGLNTYVVSRAVRAHDIKVVLSGLGGDELFAGYPSFRRASSLAALWRMPPVVRQFGTARASGFKGARMQRVGVMLREMTPAFAAYSASRTVFTEKQIQALTGRLPKTSDSSDIEGGGLEGELSLVQQVSFHEMTGYMRNTLLRDSDVFSMAHGLELRTPFVDKSVVRAALIAPDSAKLRRGRQKPLLVAAMGDLLPPSLLQRPKQGFTIPFQAWMKTELANEVEAVLGSAGTGMVGLESDGVRAVWHDFLRGQPGLNWSRPWALYTLVRWANHNQVSFSTRGISTASALA
jgi:asparagine synthase (glutamine-hydrolysing)